MNLKDVADLIHFKELHLLPRTIFSIGAVCFLGAFFIKVFLIGFLGVGLIFAALTLNFAISVLLRTEILIAKKMFTIPWMMLAQFVLCSIVTYKLLALVFYFYRHGEMPSYLQPLSSPHP